MSVVLYEIMLMAASYGVWMMVLYRRVIAEDDEEDIDQTEHVTAQMEVKETPPIPAGFVPGAIPAPIAPEAQPPSQQLPPLESLQEMMQPPPAIANLEARGNPPIPEEGIPQGWTEEQWKHYGWNWLDARDK